MSGASADNGQAYLAMDPTVEEFIKLAQDDHADMKKRVQDTIDKIQQGRENAKER